MGYILFASAIIIAFVLYAVYLTKTDSAAANENVYEKKVIANELSHSSDSSDTQTANQNINELESINSKPHQSFSNVLYFFKGILFSIVDIFVFLVVYFLLFFILGIFFDFLTKIPLLKTLLGWLFKARGDSPSMLVCILSAISGFMSVIYCNSKLIKSPKVAGVSFIIFGAALLIIHIIFLIINVASGGWLFPNIIQGIAGAVGIFTGASILKE